MAFNTIVFPDSRRKDPSVNDCAVGPMFTGASSCSVDPIGQNAGSGLWVAVPAMPFTT